MVLVAIVVCATAKAAGFRPVRTGLIGLGVARSHLLLDTLTDGGLGCALLWPFSTERFFAPWTPLPVAPIGRAFLSAEGVRVAPSWWPCVRSSATSSGPSSLAADQRGSDSRNRASRAVASRSPARRSSALSSAGIASAP